ncbi:hypothetical protein ANCCAN_11459 [Ancylostoma caninum]|uniref:Neurotransmitter-gated ion-channel ligand-binding domain-containing protein n=1 Tax=Ancylostoma caninum TaxID=29170 RepID=A0A368GFV4_ANCCA|nr:hypothetical protein ANCCAN_11459 [Ancylostoma caninum]
MLNSSYDKRIRPPNRDANGTNNPVIVDVNFYVRSISNIDFVRMEYNLQITFRQYWHDPRLEYSSMFGGKEVPDFLIITERDSIWTPDTFFLNEKRAHRHEIDKLNLMIRIHANGSVCLRAGSGQRPVGGIEEMGGRRRGTNARNMSTYLPPPPPPED